MEQIPLNASYSSFLDQPDISINELARIIGNSFSVIICISYDYCCSSDYSPPPTSPHHQFKYPSNLTSTINQHKKALLPLSFKQCRFSFPEETAATDRIEQVFEEEYESQHYEYQHFHDALTQITDAVNISAVRLLGNEAHSLPLLRQKTKQNYRKTSLPRKIMKNDFRKDLVVMFRNVMNSAD